MSKGYQWSAAARKLGQDQNTRQRHDQHDRWSLHKGLNQRSGEREAARSRAGNNWTEADEMEWSSYLTSGGNKPVGGSGYGSGGAPIMGKAPELNLPEYDEDKVSALTQKRAAPSIRRLRETTQQATAATYDNPNVKRMTVRDALQGYGTGLEGVVAGAGRAASAEYGQQYAASVNAEMAKYQGAMNRQSQEYEVASRNWLMGRETENWKDRQDYDSDPYAAFDAFYA